MKNGTMNRRTKLANQIQKALATPTVKLPADPFEGFRPTPIADQLVREFKAGEAGVNVICPACAFHVALGTDCPGCGVYAGEPCADCDQPMYHNRSCPALDALGDDAAYR